MTTEQNKALCELTGLKDQIGKQHWLNVHFRAFELADFAWKQHVFANARVGAKAVNSPDGAVLADEEGETP